jgi:SAM-dependent methyltransferase
MMKDLFSKQAGAYAKYRPSYPPDLINYIVSFVKENKHAWDCATGNGQAAVLLSPYFEKISATDISENQLKLAIRKENIFYSTAKASSTIFPDNSFDLITVAQAYHWFPFGDFEKEAKRVSKPEGIIAVWGYNIPVCEFPPLNKIINHFYKDIVGPYWDPERKYIDDYYRTVPFCFDELTPRSFEIELQWNLDDLLGYFNSWSSVMNFIDKHQHNPADNISAELSEAWPDNIATIAFRFPVFLRIGRITK